MALAFVPVNDVKRCFEILRDEVVDELISVMGYSDDFYITGRPARGRWLAVLPLVFLVYFYTTSVDTE